MPPHRLAIAMLTATCLATSANPSPPSIAPTLYADAPLAVHRDGVLNLAGTHIADITQVAYQAVIDGATEIRQENSATDLEQGELQMIARSNDPARLTVQWPASTRTQQTYSIRVKNSSGQWSNAVLINAAQPAWFSPAVISSSVKHESLPRRLQIIGRNLHSNLLVRLSGRAVVPLPSAASVTEHSGLGLLSYALPTQIAVGQYQVEYSTDGQRWLAIGNQRLEVRQFIARQEIRLDEQRFGACRADDLSDDSTCLQQALNTAMRDKSVVTLPAGQWDFYQKNSSAPNGIVVPKGVWLRGAEKLPTTLMRHGSGNSGARPLLNLSGSNRVERLFFQNADGLDAPLIKIGTVTAGQTITGNEINDIELLDNRFTHATTAIVDSGNSIRNLVIAGNEFSIDGTALYLAGNRYRTTSRFRLVDSVITGNIFRATARPAHPEQAPIASEIGGSLRLNFSDNQALATSTDNAGWRAGFFFHLNDSHEDLLIHNNVVHCAGSGGDGEAIALDNNGNTYAYIGMQSIMAADVGSVSIAIAPQSLQSGRAVPNNYYAGHWLQIVAGVGNGQARRITGYTIDANGNMRFSVSPAFTVAPVAGDSMALVSRLFQAPTVIGNVVDNRRPQCARTNLSGPHGGAISLWAPTQGALVAGNVQYNSDGIVVQHAYAMPGLGCDDCEISVMRHVALDITNNDIIDEYDWSSTCSQSGIQLRHGAAPTPDYPPPVLGLNGRITGNRIVHADGLQGGAITFPLSWHAGPARFSGSLIDGMLVERNQIDNLTGAPPSGKCSSVSARVGIHLADRLIRNTVLHNNQCRQVASSLVDRATNTLRLCTDASTNNCECTSKRVD